MSYPENRVSAPACDSDQASISGRRGTRTLTAFRPHGLANRPGNPYPATLRIEWTRRESNPHYRHAMPVSSRWTTGPGKQSGEWGSNPRSPASKAGGLPLSYPLHEWTAGESHPDFRLATATSSCWTSSPKEVRPGVEPGLPRLPGRRAASTFPDRQKLLTGAGAISCWSRLFKPVSVPFREELPCRRTIVGPG